MSKFETNNDTMPRCPYCGLVYDNAWELGLKDGDIAQIECDCGKTYDVTCCVSVDYDSTPDCALNKEEHVWEVRDYPRGKEYRWRECSVCGKVELVEKEESK